MTKFEEYECLLERSRRFYETALMQVELGALEDAYITSRYVARSYSLEEVKRIVGENTR